MRTVIIVLILFFLISGCKRNSSSLLDSGQQGNEVLDFTLVDSLALSVDHRLTDANFEFALNVFREVNQTEPNKNIMISPLSLSTALQMTYNGALTETKDAMSEVLFIENISSEELNKQIRNLIISLQDCDSKVTLNISNSIWINDRVMVKPDFIQQMEDYFLSEVMNLDFSSSNSVQAINTWVDEKTNGKIEKIVDQLSESQLMLLINAMYFKGDWKYQFNPENTQESDFYMQDGSTKKVKMMSNGGKDYTYYTGENFDAVRMPYGRDIMAMYVFLPKKEYNIDAFISGLEMVEMSQWFSSFDSLRNVGDDFIFKLPKFQLEYEKLFNDILKNLGMEVAFTDDANFGKISDHPMWIDFVKQKTFIEVNEEGSEAAAVTVVSFTDSMPPRFVVNRPFFFLIRDDRSGTILFSGKIVEPDYN